MKKIFTLLTATLLIAFIGNAQTVYNVTTNKSWSGNYPNSCNNCTFNISTGVTLTIDRNVTLQNVTFNGGTVRVNDDHVTLNSGGGGSSTFNNTKFIFDNKSRLNASAGVVINNSTFTFNDESRFNPQQLLELVNSKFYFNDDSFLSATGGPVNLKSNSLMVAGDGTLRSDAYININGPVLTLFDNSSIAIANNNNYYSSWNAYYGDVPHKWTSTATNTMNCGSSYPNRCSMPYLYGPATLTPNGFNSGTTLPVVLSDFSVRLWNNQGELSWTTEQEVNSVRFEVERSIDGTNWTKIGTVAAKGNSTTQSRYAFVDKTPSAGINYYRLKMVDMDNKYDFSQVQSIRAAASVNVRVYPNPASENVYVSLPASTSSVRLLNTAGQILQERKPAAGAGTISFAVSSYTAGTYFVQVIKADGTSSNSALLINK